MVSVQVTDGQSPILAEKEVEIVERKGRGHPDSLCDASAEALSVALSRWYREKCQKILHHNVDKAVLIGGSADVDFGRGALRQPIQVIIAGRATLLDSFSVEDLFLPVIENQLCQQVRYLRPEHLSIQLRVRPGSPDLKAIFQDEDQPPPANDTSLAVGFAPLTPLEKLVLETETFLNSEEGKRLVPELGEDIKVMGVRKGRHIRLTIAGAFLAPLVPDRQTYNGLKEKVKVIVQDQIVPKFWSGPCQVFVNTADTESSAYLTLTGTSAEHGDDGQVGRGNRASGLITPYRPMSLEAIAGKNPVNHVGKVYSIMARLIAEEIAKMVPEVQQVYCYMVSQIGVPINQPEAVAVEVWGVPAFSIRSLVNQIVDRILGQWKEIRDGFLEGKWRIF
ncbi:MAG: methionine adenosyltransferase [Armatimonadetes bacterium]|nr:methionine adenosyltransferase [Armatimonadota bacterium]MDW8122041.1 methionine adenosyltransferase [Armatimonadota bacterium]